MNNILMQALQDQLTMERQNAAIYDALSAALDVVFWDGSSKFMKHSANEEREHADKFCGYIIDRLGMPQFSALDGCNVPSGDDLALYFELALQREKMTTQAINTLCYVADEAEDPQTKAFLIPFLDEQTKSERELSDYVMMLKRLDNNGRIVFDKELQK